MSDGLKPGWRRWRFEQMVTSINQRVDDPAKAGVDYYVGLEHLDSDSLKIRRWGSPEDVSATKLLFEPGDIIFGRRRAYQRKLGVAEWRGIASAHSLVLRAKEDVVLPELLPFFMQSDLFMERAQEISVGSLSPTINWRTLAKQEFVLPPLAIQRRLVDLLGALETSIETTEDAIAEIERVKIALVEDFIKQAELWSPLSEALVDTTYGSSTRASVERVPGTTPILRIPNILRGEIDLADLKYVDLSLDELERYAVTQGDILLVRTNGNPGYVGRCVVAARLPETHVYASYLIRLRVHKNMFFPEFVAAMLNAPSIRRELRGAVRSSAGNYNINTKGIRRQRIPMPSLVNQTRLIEMSTQLDQACSALQCRANCHSTLKSNVLTKELV